MIKEINQEIEELEKENRGSKKFCSKCKKQIDRLEDHIRVKYTEKLSEREKIMERYHLNCYFKKQLNFTKVGG